MRTFNDYITEKQNDNVWAVLDRNDIFINYYYSSADAHDAADELNDDTPSLKFHVVKMNRNEVEKQ